MAREKAKKSQVAKNDGPIPISEFVDEKKVYAVRDKYGQCAAFAYQMHRLGVAGVLPKHQSDYFGWLCKCGSLVSVVSLTEIPALNGMLSTLRRKMKVKECWSNAATVAGLVPGVKIVLGQAWGSGKSGLAVDHAWNVTKDGAHFDLTTGTTHKTTIGDFRPSFSEYYAIETVTLSQFDKLGKGDFIATLYKRSLKKKKR